MFILLSAELTGLLIIPESPLVLIVNLPQGLEGGPEAAARTLPASGAWVLCQAAASSPARRPGEKAGVPPLLEARFPAPAPPPDVASLAV